MNINIYIYYRNLNKNTEVTLQEKIQLIFSITPLDISNADFHGIKK